MIRSERLANLIESFPLGVIVINSDNKIIESNKTAATLLGRFSGVAGPISLLELVHPDDQTALNSALENLLHGKRSKFKQICRVMYRPRDYRWSRLTGYTLENSEQDHTRVIILEDAAGEVEKSEELRREKEIAQAESRIQGDFLANVSHEIRTPLHTISSLVDLIQRTSLDDEQHEYADQISLAGDILLGLINNLLDYTRIKAGQLRPERKAFDVRLIVTESVRLISYEAHRKGLEVVLSISPHVPGVLVGDAPRVRQVLVNLLNNATKYTRQGTITVDLRRRQGTSSGELLFQVRDTGVGIDTESQKKLFQRYSQIRNDHETPTVGTGLGLSISRDLVSLMGGSIGVMSKPGIGSNFWFTMPITMPRSSATTLPETSRPPNIDSSMRILLVEDNRTSANVMENIFAAWKLTLVTVADGTTALHTLMDCGGDQSFALVMIDQKLPDMDGWQLASEIRHDARNDSLPLILISPLGLSTGEAKMKLLQWFNGYLPKPFTSEEVSRAISHVFTAGVDELVSVSGEETQPESVSPHCSRALIVEDHSVNRELLQILLQQMGCTVVTAANGEEAIAVALEKPDLEIIFMDIRMPGIDGYETTRRLRLQGIKIPVVAITANSHREVAEKCREAGMDGVLTKPFKNADVSRMISRQIQPPWDAAAALETFMGDTAVLQRVMSRFCTRLPGQVEELKSFIYREEWEHAGILAHGLKGSAWNLSCGVLGKLAQRIEESCHAGKLTPTEDEVSQLSLEADRVISYVKSTSFRPIKEDDSA